MSWFTGGLVLLLVGVILIVFTTIDGLGAILAIIGAIVAVAGLLTRR